MTEEDGNHALTAWGPVAQELIVRALGEAGYRSSAIAAMRVVEQRRERRLRFNAVAVVTMWHLEIQVHRATGEAHRGEIELWQWHATTPADAEPDEDEAGLADAAGEWELVEARWEAAN